MTVFQQSMTGILMILIGGLKIVLHIGSAPLLELPTCSGLIITASVQNDIWLKQAHCWGCYTVATGILLCGFALFSRNWSRRSAVSEPD